MTTTLRLLALLQTIASTLALCVAIDALDDAIAGEGWVVIVFSVCAAIVAACGYVVACMSYPAPADELREEDT